MKVIARESALRFRKSRLSLSQFARTLGVAHALRGSVRREGNAVRLELEFCRADDEAKVWTKNYDSAPQDMFAVQTHMAQELARVLGARGLEPTFANSKFFTHDAAAFDYLLKARRARDGAPDVARSEATIALAEEALKRDANFGAAAVLLSASYVAAFRAERDQATRPRFASPARRWAETAARLIPGGGADGALAFYYLYVEPDTSRSVPLARNAVRAFPNDSDHHSTLAIACFRAGSLIDAAAEQRRGIALDPLNAGKRQFELQTLARLRRVDAWERAIREHRTMIGSDQPADVNAEQRFALTGELPGDTSPMSYIQRMDWLWRERKFGEVAALAEVEWPNRNFMGEQCALKLRWGDALVRLGREKEAAILFADTLKLARDIATRPLNDPSANDTRMGQALARCGKGDEAVAITRHGVEAMPVERRQSERWDREILLAELHATLGRAPECVALLAALVKVPSGLTVPMLRVDPKWDGLREDDGFKALLAEPKNSAPL